MDANIDGLIERWKNYDSAVVRVREDAKSLQTEYIEGYIQRYKDEREHRNPIIKGLSWFFIESGDPAIIKGYGDVLRKRKED